MRFHRALAAAAITLGLVATAAQSAQADPGPDPQTVDYSTCEFDNGNLSSETLAVGTTHDRSIVVYVTSTGCPTFPSRDDHPADDGYGNPSLLFGNEVGGLLYSLASYPQYNSSTASVTADPDALMNALAGRKLTGTIKLPDGTYRPFPGPAITLLRKVTVDDAKASSKTVKKGKKVKISSHVSRADWNKDKYSAYAKVKVRVRFRNVNPDSDGDYVYDKWGSAKADKKGNVSASVKVPYSGCFIFEYLGSSSTSFAESEEVCVNTKK